MGHPEGLKSAKLIDISIHLFHMACVEKPFQTQH